MAKRGRPKKKITLEDLPPRFRKAIIQHMARSHVDSLEDALESASFLLDSNSDLFKKAVNKEAETRYRRRHFTEQNKTLATRTKKEYNQGYLTAKRTYCITYPCSVCEKNLEIQSNGLEIPTIRQALKKWGHSNCVK